MKPHESIALAACIAWLLVALAGSGCDERPRPVIYHDCIGTGQLPDVEWRCLRIEYPEGEEPHE